MKKLAIKEFLILSNEEKRIHYKDLSDHDRWLWRTYYDIPVPISIEPKEEKNVSEKERLQIEKDFERILKEFGAMKKNETIKEWREKEDKNK